MQEYEMGGACSTYCGEEIYLQGFGKEIGYLVSQLVNQFVCLFVSQRTCTKQDPVPVHSPPNNVPVKTNPSPAHRCPHSDAMPMQLTARSSIFPLPLNVR